MWKKLKCHFICFFKERKRKYASYDVFIDSLAQWFSNCVTRGPLVVREGLQGGRAYFLSFFTKKYIHSYRFYLSGSIDEFLNFCLVYFPCWFLKWSLWFLTAILFVLHCVNSRFPNIWSNDIWHIEFSWNKMVGVDSTGPQMVRDQKMFGNHCSSAIGRRVMIKIASKTNNLKNSHWLRGYS